MFLNRINFSDTAINCLKENIKLKCKAATFGSLNAFVNIYDCLNTFINVDVHLLTLMNLVIY